jgi:hypothetical protein
MHDFIVQILFSLSGLSFFSLPTAMRWAMTAQILDPPEHFGDLCRTHFRLVRDQLKKETLEWVEAAEQAAAAGAAGGTTGTPAGVVAWAAEMRAERNKLVAALDSL